MTTAVCVRHLSKTYKRGAKTLHALDDVSISIAEGEFFALLGPNGAGKSTLISALGDLTKPDAGSICILGRNLREDPVFCKTAIGIVPQEITVDPFFTVRETLRQQSGYYGLRRNDDWIDEILARLDLKAKANERVSRLSGGMKRRVLIAQALVHRPPVIVLDEPTAGVDVDLRRRIWDFMRELHGKGHTIILTTHYLEEAQILCSRLAMLNHGRVAALDETRALLSRFSGNRLRFRLLSGSLPTDAPFAFEHIEDDLWCAAFADSAELARILTILEEAGAKVEVADIGQANLEEVFLRLTDRSRETEEGEEA